jgi:hypothetical protein
MTLESYSKQNTPEFPTDPLVDRSFVTGQPCDAPCWYGMRLGKSDLEDIRTTLRELSFIDQSRIYEQSTGDFGPNEKLFLVHCTYSKESEFCATLKTSKDGYLSKIVITVAYELTLQTTIEHLGTPEYYTVSPSPTENKCYVDVYWPDKEIIVSFIDSPRDRLCIPTKNEKIELSSPILWLVYVDTSFEDQQQYERLPWSNSVP